MVMACAPAGMNGGSASCTTVIADCDAFDRGFCPAVVDSTSGMEPTPPRQVTRAGCNTPPSTLWPTAGHDRPPPKSQEEASDAMTEASPEISRHRVNAADTGLRADRQT